MPSNEVQFRIKKGYLKRRSDFLKTFKSRGIRLSLLTVYARPNDQNSHRFGLTIPRQVGSAVVRNRFKRWSREVYRKLDLKTLEVPVDFNVVVGNRTKNRETFKNVEHREFQEQLQNAIQLALKNLKPNGRGSH